MQEIPRVGLYKWIINIIADKAPGGTLKNQSLDNKRVNSLRSSLITRIASSALLMVMVIGLSNPSVAQGQRDQELLQEQEAIESGDGLSARGKKALFRARGKQDDGDFAEAASIMTGWLDGDPGRAHPLLLFNLALSHFALDQDRLAYEDLTQAVELEPRYGRGWLRLGEAAYELEKYMEAGEAFWKAYDLTPEHTPEILYYAGVSLLMGKEPERALGALEKLLNEHREGADLDWYQAMISAGIEAGRPGVVGPFVDRLLEDNPSEVGAWELSYQFSVGREDYKAAAVSLTVAGYLRPLSHDETVQLGDLYAMISVPVQAARYYEEAMGVPATDVETGRADEFERLASAWLGAHDHGRARSTLKTALGEKETVGLWSLLGDLEYMDGNFEAALTAFGSACDLDQDFGRGWLMMGYCAIELGRETEARRHLNRAAEYPGTEASARNLLGRVGS
jgi:tetratricopeptide (TPR) repeat protein